jgi:hypothetical protein
MVVVRWHGKPLGEEAALVESLPVSGNVLDGHALACSLGVSGPTS